MLDVGNFKIARSFVNNCGDGLKMFKDPNSKVFFSFFFFSLTDEIIDHHFRISVAKSYEVQKRLG